MLVSPSESKLFRKLGRSTWRTEDLGVDAAWCARGRWWGVQRKALADLCASVQDGRLAKELIQMRQLDVAVLILETQERGGADPREVGGVLMGVGQFGRGWTGKQLRGVLWGVADQGVRIERTRDEQETIARIRELEAWSLKDRHGTGKGRGGVVGTDVFGHRGDRDYGIYFLSGLPGVGPEIAGAIWDKFGGMPMELRAGIGEKELLSVKGVGRVTARRVLDMFGGKA